MSNNIINLNDYKASNRIKNCKNIAHKKLYENNLKPDFVEAEIIRLLTQLIEMSENSSNSSKKTSINKNFTVHKNPTISNSKI